jgi:hypothetical protein
MTFETSVGAEMEGGLLCAYFRRLVDLIFKILPMREDGDETLPVYVRSLQIDLAGLYAFVPQLQEEPTYLSLLSIMQYFCDNPDAPVSEIRREVFKAINICKRLCAEFRSDERRKEER